MKNQPALFTAFDKAAKASAAWENLPDHLRRRGLMPPGTVITAHEILSPKVPPLRRRRR